MENGGAAPIVRVGTRLDRSQNELDALLRRYRALPLPRDPAASVLLNELVYG